MGIKMDCYEIIHADALCIDLMKDLSDSVKYTDKYKSLFYLAEIEEKYMDFFTNFNKNDMIMIQNFFIDSIKAKDTIKKVDECLNLFVIVESLENIFFKKYPTPENYNFTHIFPTIVDIMIPFFSTILDNFLDEIKNCESMDKLKKLCKKYDKIKEKIGIPNSDDGAKVFYSRVSFDCKKICSKYTKYIEEKIEKIMHFSEDIYEIHLLNTMMKHISIFTGDFLSFKKKIFKKCKTEYDRTLFDLIYYSEEKPVIYNLQKYLENVGNEISDKNIEEKINMFIQLIQKNIYCLYETKSSVERIFSKVLKFLQEKLSIIGGRLFFRKNELFFCEDNKFILQNICYVEFFTTYEAYLTQHIENNLDKSFLDGSINFLKDEKIRIENFIDKLQKYNIHVNNRMINIYKLLTNVDAFKNTNSTVAISTFPKNFLPLFYRTNRNLFNEVLIEDHSLRIFMNNFRDKYYGILERPKTMKGNKLEFLIEYSSCVLECSFKQGKKEVRMPILSGFIFCYIDKKTGVSIEQISQYLNIDEKLVREAIVSFKDMVNLETNMYKINHDFVSKKRSEIITNPVKKESDDDALIPKKSVEIFRTVKQNGKISMEKILEKVRKKFPDTTISEAKKIVEDYITRDFFFEENNEICFISDQS